MAYGDRLTYEFLIVRLSKELNNLGVEAESIRNVANLLYSRQYSEEEYIGAMAVLVDAANNIDEITSDWSKYISKYKGLNIKGNNKTQQQLELAQQEIISLKGKLSTYSKLLKEKDNELVQIAQKQATEAVESRQISDNEQLLRDLNNINTKISSLNTKIDTLIVDKEQYDKLYNALRVVAHRYKNLAGMSELIDTLQQTLETIEENSKLIASSKGNREKQKKAIGENSNRYIQEIDTDELIRVYRENNYSIPKYVKDNYHRKYGITYNGLRERLIKAGVWVGRQPK